MAFDKKLRDFLTLATHDTIITHDTSDALLAYAHKIDAEKRGFMSLSAALGGLGALIIGFGFILIISHNWYNISNSTKIASFLALLASTHFGGLWLTSRDYGKTAASLHFLGAGLFIAGIGLIAQIYQLHSESGISFLIWCTAIAPLAILLRNGPIALLSLIAFAVWGHKYGEYGLSAFPMEEAGHVTFSLALGLTTLLTGIVLNQRRSPMADFLLVPGFIFVAGWIYIMGFSHHVLRRSFFDDQTVILPLLTFLPAIGLMVYAWFNSNMKRSGRLFLLALVPTLAVVIMMLMITAGGDYWASDTMKRVAFGRTRFYNVFGFLTAATAWVAWFSIAFWSVIYGALQQRRWLMNIGVIMVGVGVVTRFLDLMHSMLDTGLMFVASGVVLLITGFLMEKWRRRLISRINSGKTILPILASCIEEDTNNTITQEKPHA